MVNYFWKIKNATKDIYKHRLTGKIHNEIFENGFGNNHEEEMKFKQELYKIIPYLDDYEKRGIETDVDHLKIEFIRKKEKQQHEWEKLHHEKEREERIKKREAIKIKKAEENRQKEIKKNINELLKEVKHSS